MRGRARVEVKSERTSGEVSTHRLGDEKVGERERESGRAGERERTGPAPWSGVGSRNGWRWHVGVSDWAYGSL